MNESFSEELLGKLMATADTNGDGEVDLQEFMDWIYDFDKAEFSKDVSPSMIPCAKSPSMVSALKRWFETIDMNRHGSIEYEEFALASVAFNSKITLNDIAADFGFLDINGNRKVTWTEFSGSYCQLLDAIPRPIEEKIEMINSRSAALVKKCAEHGAMHPSAIIAKMFLQYLQSHFGGGCLGDAFLTINIDSDSILSLVEFREAVLTILDLPKGATLSEQSFRVLFRELDINCEGGISLEELDRALTTGWSSSFSGRSSPLFSLPALSSRRRKGDPRR